MPDTFANQKVVHINRERCTDNFLQVKKDNLYDAYRTLNATATMLWLYLAANKDGYSMALSPQAVFNQMGMPTTTCRDQIKILIREGYLVPKSENSNVYDFYEVARTPSVKADNTNGVRNSSDGSRSNLNESRTSKTAEVREINNKYKNNIDNEWIF